MTLVRTVDELQEQLLPSRSKTKKIGFVPTMGALHAGHLSLVEKCIAENDICVVSIFVNPTQFNNKSDLENYPRTLEADYQLLQKHGVNVVFAPSVDEIYPKPDTRVFDFGQIDKVMEGAHRPGHFNGVAQVVSRLFDIVSPQTAYFGEKDFQQIAVIREMVKQLNYPIKIVTVPIKREESGLAMSSRNTRLSDIERESATNIYATIKSSKDKQLTVTETTDYVVNRINATDNLEVEYFDIVDGNTLQSIKNWDDTEYAVGCVAVFCKDVRLIDNITYKKG